MMTKRQEALINSFISTHGDQITPAYMDIIAYLSELDYNPYKLGSGITFKHDLHTKQMAKLGTKGGKKKGFSPFFALRFSVCRGYSQRFSDVVGDYIAKYPTREARCVNGECTYCGGEPGTHVYTYTASNCEGQTHCGAYAVEIPDVTADDVEEIKKLIKEEHAYLMRHQVGVEVE